MWIKTPDEMYINADNVISLEWIRYKEPIPSGYKHAFNANLKNGSTQLIVQCKTDDEKEAINENIKSYLAHGDGRAHV